MTTTQYPSNLASAKQLAFIDTLVDERVFTSSLPPRIGLTSRNASSVISYLLSCPKKPRPVAVTAAAGAAPDSAFEGIPNSKYALEVDFVSLAVHDVQLPGDILFVEVREYKQRTYLRRLTGAPGDFTRSRLSARDSAVVLAALKADPAKAALLFSEKHQCCARCLAELTDQTSRERGLGPVCAKAFGF